MLGMDDAENAAKRLRSTIASCQCVESPTWRLAVTRAQSDLGDGSLGLGTIENDGTRQLDGWRCDELLYLGIAENDVRRLMRT